MLETARRLTNQTASTERITSVTFLTIAGWNMVMCHTTSIVTADTSTDIFAFIVYTGLCRWAVLIKNTFRRTENIRVAEVFRET